MFPDLNSGYLKGYGTHLKVHVHRNQANVELSSTSEEHIKFWKDIYLNWLKAA
jgi:hypothetical protein